MIGIAAAGAGGDDDVPAQLAEQLGANRVLLAFADRDVRRMGMTGHIGSSSRNYSFTLVRWMKVARDGIHSAVFSFFSISVRRESDLRIPAPSESFSAFVQAAFAFPVNSSLA